MSWTKEMADARRERRRAARAAVAEALPPYAPETVQGPSGTLHAVPPPQVAPGLELRGQTTLVNPDGSMARRYDMGRKALGKPAAIPEGLLPQEMTVHIRGDGQEYSRHVKFKPGEAERFEGFREWVETQTAGIEPLAPVPAPALDEADEDILAMLNWGDLHLGMLTWAPETGAHHDLAIGARDIRVATRMAIDRAPAAGRFLFVNQGDLFHAQDNLQRTPRSEHKLDVDGRFDKVFDAAVACIRDGIDHALTKFGAVRFIGIPGNHDPHTPHMVASVLGAWYRNDPRVTIDPAFGPFAFEEFGANLLGFAHGPSVTRIERLPGIMVNDMAAAWGRTVHREWHIGDIHHVTAREFAGVTVWSHGIMPPKDAWTHESGYRAMQRMMQTTYHRKYGRREMKVLTLGEVRDALAAHLEGTEP